MPGNKLIGMKITGRKSEMDQNNSRIRGMMKHVKNNAKEMCK